jgi:hypothetical protein
MPKNPNAPAMSAMTRNTKAQYSMIPPRGGR